MASVPSAKSTSTTGSLLMTLMRSVKRAGVFLNKLKRRPRGLKTKATVGAQLDQEAFRQHIDFHHRLVA
jgi:hypothetical protein